MSSFSKDPVFLILEFLKQERLENALHILESESGLFFNMRYFEAIVTAGEWDKAEQYMSGFTKVDDNRNSTAIFFGIRKMKYIEALDKRDHAKAVEIFQELKVLAKDNEEHLKKTALLLSLENIWEDSPHGDLRTARATNFSIIKKLIETNPLFHGKLQFPTIENSSILSLLTQANRRLSLLRLFYDNPPHVGDYNSREPYGALAPFPLTIPSMGSVPRVGIPLLGPNSPLVPGPTRLRPSLAWAMGLAWAMEFVQGLDGSRPLRRLNEVNNLPVARRSQGPAHTSYSSDDLPKTVVANLTQGSAVKSLDFHPVQQTLLLVGTNNGDIAVWEVGRRERLAFRKFKVWDLGKCSKTLQASFAKESTAWMNRLLWSPDGNLFGVAYSKHILHLYKYHCGDDNEEPPGGKCWIDAHTGNVNDLAFSHPNNRQCIITCGEDKTVKIWDTATGSRLYIFAGYQSSVYSVCSRSRDNTQFLFSTGTDGKIVGWINYNSTVTTVKYDAPGYPCTRIACSGDGTRIFLCGTCKEGEPYIAEWHEKLKSVKQTYHGLGKQSVGVVQFDTLKSKYLAAGDEFEIKFWDMDNVNLLQTTDAEGGLPASPVLRSNKEGTLLAVATSKNGVKILGNALGVKLLESLSQDASRIASETAAKAPTIGKFGASSSAAGTSIGVSDRISPVMLLNEDTRSVRDMERRIMDELQESKIWEPTEITLPSQLRSLRLPDNMLSARIVGLIYTNSGGAVLALASDAVHKVWKWEKNELNSTGKATTNVPPQLWKPSSGILMTSSTSEKNLEAAVPCFALSKNDSYVTSASGGEISLYHMFSFMTMATFMPPPPAATAIAFHPQDNNIIVVGMEDSSVQIYDIHHHEVQRMLKGHQKRVTGLAFSNIINVLVSSGADAQLCVWGSDRWEKQASKFLQITYGASGKMPTPLAPIHVEFHQVQVRLLVLHETGIAIYEAPELECIKQRVFLASSGSITGATYSCDSQSIYASFEDGSVAVLTAATLTMRCRISPAAYIPWDASPSVHPLVIAAHPSEPNQFALGLNDGGVYVLEPVKAEGSWDTTPPLESGAGP